MKQEYCFGDHEICARYRVRLALGEQAVPDDLLPGEYLRAATLIRQVQG